MHWRLMRVKSDCFRINDIIYRCWIAIDRQAVRATEMNTAASHSFNTTIERQTAYRHVLAQLLPASLALVAVPPAASASWTSAWASSVSLIPQQSCLQSGTLKACASFLICDHARDA